MASGTLKIRLLWAEAGDLGSTAVRIEFRCHCCTLPARPADPASPCCSTLTDLAVHHPSPCGWEKSVGGTGRCAVVVGRSGGQHWRNRRDETGKGTPRSQLRSQHHAPVHPTSLRLQLSDCTARWANRPRVSAPGRLKRGDPHASLLCRADSAATNGRTSRASGRR